MHRHRSIVTLNLTISLLFGMLIGIVFPFYVQLFGIHYTNNLQFVVFFMSCVLAGLLVGFVAFFINKITIIRIIKLIGHELKDMAEGQGDLTHTINIDSNDDVGQLAYWFNAFVQRLDLMVGNTKQLAVTMRENGIEFNINLRHAGDILHAVFNNLESMENVSRSQQELVGTTKNQLGQFSQSIVEISEYSNVLIDSFKDFAHYIQKQANLTQVFFSCVGSLKHSLGDQNSGKTGEHSEHHNDLLGVTIKFAKESTRSLDEQAQRFTRIEKILEEIEDIAESTHLLSINASIEAARAGESGRGFTIVALQIRNLATNSGSLTSEIREQIEAIMNVTKSSGAQLADLRSTLNSHMENVITDMQQLMNSAKDISRTVEIISSMQPKLKERIEDIGNVFTEANVVRESLLQDMEELNSCTDRLRNNVNRISMGSDEIDKVTKSFFAQGAETEQQALMLVKSMQDYQTSLDKSKKGSSNNLFSSSNVITSNLGGTSSGKSFA